jgi:hypothetical protein
METGIEKNMDSITNCIFIFRSEKVIFDSDLARIYGVDTKSLKRAVKRNIKRFPPDFMFQLSREEFLRCQNYTSSWGGARYLPMVFTEHGAVMLASVLNSSSQ